MTGKWIGAAAVMAALLAAGCASGAAKPEKGEDKTMVKKINLKHLQLTGALRSARYDAGVLVMEFEHAQAELSIVNGSNVRYRVAFAKVMPPEYRYAVVDRAVDKDALPIEEDKITGLSNGAVTAMVDRASGRLTVGLGGLAVTALEPGYDASNKTLYAVMPWRGERFFGLGEKTGNLELTGRVFTNYNSDTYKYHKGTDPIYCSIPFYVAAGGDHEYGLFLDSPARSFFHLRTNDYAVGAKDTVADFTVIPGKPAEALAAFTRLTGRAAFPPIWGFGYHQSRYSYMSQKEVMDVATRMSDAGMPCDVIYLDIDFMSNRMSFTWNPKAFPDPAAMNRELEKRGIRTVAIIDPGIKVDTNYSVYKTGLEKNVFLSNKGRLYKGQVWPGTCVFPDYTLPQTVEWWGELYRPLTALGIAGFWNDMNEPSVFNVPGGTLPDTAVMDNFGNPTEHQYVHNAYGISMTRATYLGLEKIKPGRRVFLLSRAGYAGIQRYAMLWTGDNTSNWEHLRMNVTMVLGLGLSGVPFTGADLGGYTGSPNEELFTRWMQLGTFIPFMRGHTEQGTKHQEPYVFTNQTETIRRYMQLRYRLLPYLYTAAAESVKTGMPVNRPLFLEYGNNYLDIEDEFLFGPSILVAPVLESKAKNRTVILPQGHWYDYHTGNMLPGGRINAEVTLSDIPVYVKAGTLLPVYEQKVRSTMDLSRDRSIAWIFYPDAEGRAAGILYEDDGETTDYLKGRSLLTRVEAFRTGDVLEVKLQSEGGFKAGRKMSIGLPEGIKTVRYKGREMKIKEGKALLE